ncbi:MAG: bacteriophage Gp15 family protein [Spirochaetaceae bacterium]|jgi:hypothetical protein|nr:bacteriophage Gp15 family protein [Spirochaetaceae bacterium]
MIDFSRADRRRPSSVYVGGIEYPVKTDFHYWIAFGRLVEGRETFPLGEADFLYQWGIPGDREAGFRELVKFYENRQPLPRPAGKAPGVIPYDWELDSEYIYAAFMQQYRIDLVAASPHWHDFCALFNGLAGTKLNDIISARYGAEKKGPLAEMRQAWEIARDDPDLLPAPRRRRNEDWPTTGRK